MLARHRKLRPWRATAYFLLAAGGIIIWIDPTRNVAPLPVAIRWVWASFIVVGGLISMLGAIKDWWICEFAALPLVSVGFTSLIWVSVAGGGTTGRLAFSCWIAAIIVQLVRRWLGLLKFANTLRRAKRKGGPHA